MGDYTAIGAVGETLVGLLRARIAERRRDSPDVLDIEGSQVGLASPDDVDAGEDLRLTLYLYQVSESAHLKNAEREAVGTDRLRRPPLALDLHYLLTAYPATRGHGPSAVSRTDRTAEQHRLLGLAMQVLQDNAVVDGDDLSGGLTEQLYVSLEPQATEDVLNIWNTFAESPYQPSVSYVVGPVRIDSTAAFDAYRVVERDIEYAQIGEEDRR